MPTHHSNAPHRTPLELAQLKQKWQTDPAWNIEDTKGFEAHRAELRGYRQQWESLWEEGRREKMSKKADDLGCPGNLALAAYVEKLEGSLTITALAVSELQERVDQLEKE